MLKRILRAYRRHGRRKFWWLVIYNFYHHLKRLGARGESDPAGRLLDAALGVETTQIREIGSLELESPNATQAVRYQPSAVDLVRRILQQCALDHDYHGFVFVDFGCGKGRVMLLAAELPFRRIIGIEFSPELHRIAQANIGVSRPHLDGCKDLQVVLGDAADFIPPADPLVCYFYNPFGESVMRTVVSNIEKSLDQVPRQIVIIYAEPMHRMLFDRSRRWTAIHHDQQVVVYRSRDTVT